MSEARVVVRQIAAVQTHDLRRRVLRDADPHADVAWPADDADSTVHLGAIIGSRIVAISTWLLAPYPDEPDARAVQLRGMATDPANAGSGIGVQLLDAGRSHAASIGARIIWANARMTALGFYERYGFAVIGPVFATPDTGLPHRLVRISTRREHDPISPST